MWSFACVASRLNAIRDIHLTNTAASYNLLSTLTLTVRPISTNKPA